jgi:hypothetical protein
MGITIMPKPYREDLGVGLKCSYSVALIAINLCIPESNCKIKQTFPCTGCRRNNEAFLC